VEHRLVAHFTAEMTLFESLHFGWIGGDGVPRFGKDNLTRSGNAFASRRQDIKSGRTENWLFNSFHTNISVYQWQQGENPGDRGWRICARPPLRHRRRRSRLTRYIGLGVHDDGRTNDDTHLPKGSFAWTVVLVTAAGVCAAVLILVLTHRRSRLSPKTAAKEFEDGLGAAKFRGASAKMESSDIERPAQAKPAICTDNV